MKKKEYPKKYYSNVLLSDGKILFWYSGYDQCEEVEDFLKDFIYAKIPFNEYRQHHELKIETQGFVICRKEDYEWFERTGSFQNFYKQFELSPDFKGWKPY